MKNLRNIRTHKKVRAKSRRPRLSIFRSNKYITAQVINDTLHKTICSASSREIKDAGTKTEIARKVGELVAEKAKKESIGEVAFDRGKYAYHGRVRALAEGARARGLTF